MDHDTVSDDDDSTDIASNEVQGESSNSAGNVALKKGPWCEEEDAILKDFVEKHGAGNWNAVQTFTGLPRCGKSCRLRWMNQLRPALKKYSFTPEEERRVIELHAKLGPKWARMAAELPGRTDNDIKNFWHTRSKRRQRDGLPEYPPDVRVEWHAESPQSPEPTPFPSVNISSSHGFIDPIYDEIEEFKIPQNPLSRTFSSPAFLDDPLRNLLPQVPKPNPLYSFNNMFSAIYPQGPVPYCKYNYLSAPFEPQGLDPYQSFNYIHPTSSLTEQLRDSSITSSALTSGFFPAQSNLQKHQLQPHELSTVNGFGSMTDNLRICFNPNGHADINGYSFIEPSFGSTMMELPSIQTPVSDFGFMSTLPPTPDHLTIPSPQAGTNMLQSVATTHEIDSAEKIITDDFFNFDAALEIYVPHDDASMDSSNRNTSMHQLPHDASMGSDQIPATLAHISAEATNGLGVSPYGVSVRPTVPDSDRDYTSTYQLDTSAPNESLDGDIPNFKQGLDYTMHDEELATFISDEDGKLIP